jgi:hypothetical protein
VNVPECAEYDYDTEESSGFHCSEQAMRKRREHPEMGDPEQQPNERYSNEKETIYSLVLVPDSGRFTHRVRGARENGTRYEKFAEGREHTATLSSQPQVNYSSPEVSHSWIPNSARVVTPVSKK